MIDRQTIDRIFASANIVEVVGDFITLKKKGVNYSACCPFHNEKTPSFVVSPSKGLFKCFGCGKGGNAVTFVMEHESMSYVDALKYVAKKYNIEVNERELTEEEIRQNDDRESMMAVTSFAARYFIDQLHNTPDGRNIGLGYFKERGISDSAVNKFELGYCPAGGDTFTRAAIEAGFKEQFLLQTGLTIKREDGSYYDRFSGRMMFPIHGISGRVTAFGGRTLRTDKKVSKYLNSPESEIYHKSNVLYGLYLAKKAITQADNCILVEGYTDVISMHQAGIENVVASSGTSLTEEQIRLISRFTRNVTIIYDGDAAGIKASLRGINMILSQGMNVRIVPLPPEHDPDTFARSRSAVELEEYILSNAEDFMSFKTKLLLADAGNDPLKKASTISDIVESIALIPDGITRSVYISSCAKQLEVSEEVLIREVGRRRIRGVDGKEGVAIYDNQQKRQAQEQAVQTINTNTSIGSSIDELEKEIIKYLLKYGNQTFRYNIDTLQSVDLEVADTLINEIMQHGIPLHNPIYRTIFDTYRTLLEQNGSQGVPIHHFTNHSDPAVCNVVVDLLTSDEVYTTSRLWERFDIHTDNEHQRLSLAIPRVIKLYKSKAIEELISELTKQLENEDLDEKTLRDTIKKISALNHERIVIAKELSRLIL